HIVLHDSRYVADGHRKHGHYRKSGHPGLVQIVRRCDTGEKREAKYKDANERGEGRSFRARRHETRNRGGGTLVNVGSPNVKRSSGYLESESDDHHSGADQKQSREIRIYDPFGD